MDGVESKISELINDLSSLRRQLDANEQLRETKERVDGLENTIEYILNRQEEESSSVTVLSQQAEKDRADLELLRVKMDSLDQQIQLNNQKIEDVKHQVWHLIATNLVPLEHLRESLTQNVRETGMNKTRLVELDQDVSQLKRSVSDAVVPPVGFTAYFQEPVRLFTKDAILTGFTDVRVNVLDCFNPTSGCFTAPVNGMYAASVTLCQMSTGYLEVFLHRKEHGSPDSTWVAHIVGHREINGNSDTGVAVVWMKRGDELFIKINDLGQLNYPWLTEGTSFSCFLINKL